MRCEEGSDIEFLVELSHDDLKGEWWQGGVRLTSDDRCNIRSSGRQHFLRLSDLTLPDTSLIAFTTDTLRTMGQLTVIEHPLTITQPPQDCVVHEAGLATFQCEVSKQEAVVTWSKVTLMVPLSPITLPPVDKNMELHMNIERRI